MVNFLAALVGHMRGGLSYVLIVAMYLISGISGSKAADMAAVAPVLVPEMKRRGVPPGEMVALLAASGGDVGNHPAEHRADHRRRGDRRVDRRAVHRRHVAGGTGAAALAGWCSSAPAHERPQDPRAGARRSARLFVIALPALILPFLIRYAVLGGVTTATEVATVGVV